jgi:hypothetical protein
MTSQSMPEPPIGEKPADIRIILRYSNGAIVMKSFTEPARAANFLSGI